VGFGPPVRLRQLEQLIVPRAAAWWARRFGRYAFGGVWVRVACRLSVVILSSLVLARTGM